MESQYKVEFLSTRDIKGAFKINMPTEETDLKYRLSALLEERFSQGYKLNCGRYEWIVVGIRKDRIIITINI